MATLSIEGRDVQVDDGFLKLSPADQNRTVEEIAQSMKVGAGAPSQAGPAAPDVSTPADVAKSAGVGVGEGVLGLGGLVGDINSAVGRGTAWAAGKLMGEHPSADQQASLEAMRAGPLALFHPKTTADLRAPIENVTGPFYEPQTTAGEYARTIGQFAPGAVGGPGSAASRIAGQVLVPAIASETAGQLTKGTAAEPYARFGAGLAGGIGSTLAASGGRTAASAAAGYLDPLTEAGRQRAASTILREAATNPVAARQALETMPDPLVPGSQPTTFQAAGDLGLGALERSVQTKNPEAFAARRADQNTARLGALEDIQPGGHPEAVSKAFRDRLAQIDSETDNALQAATQTAQGRTQALGGNITPDAAGDSLRDSLSGAEAAARARTSAMWKAIDPDNTMNIPTGNTSAAAKSVLADMTPYAQPMEGAEANVFRLAQQMPGEVRVRMLGDLRSNVNTLMRQEMANNGASPAYARMSRLRGAIENDIDGVVRQRAAQEAEAVAAGSMRAENTLAGQWGLGLQADKEAWLADRAGRIRSEVAGGDFGPVTGGSRGIPSAYRGEGQVGGRPNDPAGNPGIPGRGEPEPGLPFDDAARERLKEATAAIRERHETFGTAVNSQILARSGSTGPYRLAASSVPDRLFFPGSASAQRIAEYRRAVGDPQALDVLQDYAANRLIRVAGRPDGTLDPAKVASWRRNHADALRAFPELDQRFADAGRASETMAEAAATRRTRMDDYQRGIVGRLIGVQDPADVTKLVGGVFGRQDAVATMKSLADAVKNSPDAREGLRKAVAEHIASRFIGNTEAATTGLGTLKSDALQSFVTQNQAALRQVFSPGEMETLTRIAVDIQRSNRSLYAVKIPGQSNTAQDLTRVGKDAGFGTILGRILASGGATGLAGFSIGGPIGGAAFAIGGAGVQALRQYGVKKIDDLVRDAMLDPQLGKILLQQTPARNAEGVGKLIAQRYRTGVLANNSASTDEEPRRATAER